MFRSAGTGLIRNVLFQDMKGVGTHCKMDNTRGLASKRTKEPTTLLSALRSIKPRAYALLAFPLGTGALAVWQVKRAYWKANVIEELEARLRKKPRRLPETLDEISKLEYCPVTVKGHFDHTREIFLGPRTLLNSKKPASTLLSDGAKNGFFVLTPFKPDDRDYYILVNRGWIPTANRDPKTRKAGQIEGEVELTGLVRLTEKRPQFVLENDPEINFWLYRDLDKISAACGLDTAPISIDAIEDTTVPGGPIGGQTLINVLTKPTFRDSMVANTYASGVTNDALVLYIQKLTL